MDQAIPVFGDPDVCDPILRPGGYAVIFHQERIAVVAAPGGLFLPGGGQDEGESAEAAAVREAREECGLVIEPDRLLGVADEVVFAPREPRHYRKRSTFFLANLVGTTESAEPDHVLLWLERAKALTRLRHGSQRWAVQQAGPGPD